jgi:hypothetical protein
MAAGDGKRSHLRLVIVITILSLLLLAPFTVYYLWRSPYLYTKGLVFTPSPTLDLNCKNNSFSKCDCPKMDGSIAIDYTRCPLEEAFAVYVYRRDDVALQYPSDMTDIDSILKETDSWTDTPSKACLFVCIVGPSPSNVEENLQLNSLPHWNGGINHVLINIPDIGQTSPPLASIGSSLVANGQAVKDMRLNHLHMLAPPVSHSEIPIAPPSLYEISRTHTLYFEGVSSQSVSTDWSNPAMMKDLDFNVKFTCERSGAVIRGTSDEEWALCTPQEQRLLNCANSTFALVLGAPDTSAITYTRLSEALRCGAVPVIVGVRQLPFDSVINWNKAAILLPFLSSPHDLSGLLTSLQPETLMGYRSQGRFLHETYFSSRKAVLHTIVAILRSRFMHPPPPAPDFNGKIFKVNDDDSTIPPSPRFLNNYTIYSEELWNNPPGPFFMYPVTPYRQPYVSSMFYKPTNNSPSYTKPPVLKGDPFRSTLHGIHPPEGLTVVALTYHRSQHLAQFVKGFQGCSFLAKIVIVWNDEKEPDKNFKLPNIGVPIEVR